MKPQSATPSDEEVLAVPVQDILREIDHIEKNGISLKKFGGEEIHEGRCRELCAMYLREFIQAEAMGKRLMKMPFFARLEQQQNDAKDAARYRLLRKHYWKAIMGACFGRYMIADDKDAKLLDYHLDRAQPAERKG